MDKWKDAYGILFVTIALIFAAFAIYNLFYLLRTVTWPYDLDYSEAVILATKLQYLYKGLGSYPYLITYYPPLYYLLVDAFRAAYSSSLPYLYTRVLSVFATLACASMLYLISRRFVKGREATLLAPLMFLSVLQLTYWGFAPYPTSFELLFDLTAIFFLLKYADRRGPIYASIAITVAFFFRQSAALMFVAIIAYLVLNRKFKDCWLFAAPFLMISVPVTLLLDFLTGGRYVLSLFILPLITPPDVHTLLAIANTFVFETPFIVFLPFAAYWIVKNPRTLMAMCFVFSFGSLLSSIKTGANLTYITTLFALFCVVAAMGMELAFSGKNSRRKMAAAAYVFIALILLEASVIPKFTGAYQNTFKTPQTAEIGFFLRNFNGNVLVESPSVAIEANKSVLFEPSMFSYLKDRGLWNDSQIVSDISMHKFSAISFPAGFPVTSGSIVYYEDPYGRFSNYTDITKAIQTYYKAGYVNYGWAVYVPKTS